MTVIVGNNVPDCVRGMLKRWFIEPKPNVFVGSVTGKVKDEAVMYVQRNSELCGFLIISSDNSCQGFRIESSGETKISSIDCSGLQLLTQKLEDG